MKIIIIQVIFVISSNIISTKSTIIFGKDTNMTAIMWKAWLKGSGQMQNLLPPTHFNDNYRWRHPGADAAVGRRYLQRLLAAAREALLKDEINIFSNEDQESDNNELFNDDDEVNISDTKISQVNNTSDVREEQSTITDEEFKYNDFSDYAEDPSFIEDLTKQLQLPKSLRSSKKEARQEKAKAALIQSQHDRRVKEIVDFMETHKTSTVYLYEEVQRIKRQRVPKDSLRIMVEYLEQPGMEKLKRSVLKCFHDRRKLYKKVDVWKHRVPNNLVINVVKDPQNYGFVN